MITNIDLTDTIKKDLRYQRSIKKSHLTNRDRIII
jgi:hypothetical protein